MIEGLNARLHRSRPQTCSQEKAATEIAKGLGAHSRAARRDLQQAADRLLGAPLGGGDRAHEREFPRLQL